MVQKNIQIKHHNGTSWDELFPKTKATVTLLNDGTTVEARIGTMLTTLLGVATKDELNAEINKIIGAAPDALDTLKELATALGNDANFATTMTTLIGTKVSKEGTKVLSQNDFTTVLKSKLDGLKDHTAEISTLTTGKADKTTTYTKLETDAKINTGITGKADKVTTYTKVEIDTKLTSFQANAVPVQPTAPAGASVWFEELV